MSEQTDDNGKSSVQASDNGNAIGGNIEISSTVQAGGNIQIGHTIGYTAEQVSALITQIQTTFQPKPFDGRCPYKGLDVFEEEDAELFFGREELVDDLVSRVKDSQTVFVTGPSGSGKSSLVRAGLIHALRQGAVKESHSENWLYATMRPGRDPFEALAGAFARLKSPEFGDYVRANASKPDILQKCAEAVLSERKDQRLVLFMDQFEETFTQLSADKARTFIETLSYAATIDDGRVILLFSMRSDFVSNCATYPQLNSLLNQQFVQIGAMQPEELVSAIAQPALRVGLKIDPDLIAQIINDMEGEPGSLPLMQFALKDLFDSVQAKGEVIQLTLDDYLQRGGIQKSLERHADAAFASLGAHEQELARSIFSSLIEVGRGTQDTKRTAIFDELIPANAKTDEIEAIVQKLADARLITTNEMAGKDTVTISHEKLIDAWPWLRKLVNENRGVIALQNEIASDAKEWEEHKRDASYLYAGGRLANVSEQVAGQKLTLNGLAQEFVRVGKARQQRNRQMLVGVVGAVMVLLVIGVVVFSQQSNTNARLAEENANIANTAQSASKLAFNNAATARANAEEAQKQAKISRVGELAAQSVAWRDKNFLISLLLGVEAFKGTNDQITSVQAQSALLENSLANPRLEQFLGGNTGPVLSAVFSPDGKTLASGTFSKDILLWDVNTRQTIDQLRGNSYVVRSVAFSPDGKMLASGSQDATITLWNMETRQAIGQLSGDSGHSGAITSVAFSPDGKMLASGSNDKTIILWDIETRQPISLPLNGDSGHSDVVTSVAFSADGNILASGGYDGMVIMWNVKTGHPIVNLPIAYTDSVFHEEVASPVLSVAFSPDGSTLAAGDYDKNVTLWNVQTGKPIHTFTLSRHTDIVRTLAFSPNGKTLASGSADRTIILWDVATGQFLDQLKGHSDLINSLSFSPDVPSGTGGSILASGSGDTTIVLWDMNQRQPLARSLNGFENSGFIHSIVFSPDGRTLAFGGEDKTVMLWDVEKGRAIGDEPLHGHTGSVRSVAFNPDGRMLASGSCGKFNENNLCVQGEIILWDVATRQPIGQPLSGHTTQVNSVAFSPDGRMLASGSCGKFNENNLCVQGEIILWDVATRQPIGQPLSGHTTQVNSVAFSPDGRMLASGSEDNNVILWDMKTYKAIVTLEGHSASVTSIAFSPNGKTLASGSEDNNVILWDMKTYKAIVTLKGHSKLITSLAFRSNGKILASGSFDKTIILWDVKTHQSIGSLSGHSDPVQSIIFSPDGKTLASSSHNIILWDLDEDSWINAACRRVGRNFMRKDWELYFPSEEYRKTCDEFPLEPSAVTEIP